METIHKQEHRVRDISTRSVTLFPTRAQVIREIKDVPLKPGANQITVVGLTPTVDEHSIKVEGTGSAIISDITVELLPNRDIFQEIYPDSDDSDSEDESELEEEDDAKDSSEMEDVRKALTELRDEKKAAMEKIASAESRLKILDAYGKMLDRKKGVEIDDGLEKYRIERDKVFQDHMDGTVRDRDLTKEITELQKDEARFFRLKMKEEAKTAKAKAKVQKAKDKERQKRERREAERRKEKERVRKERESFWPRQCYNIRITLEAASFTPMSSRRASIASSTEITKVIPEKEPVQSPGDDEYAPTCDISLTYVTSGAYWSPSYDLQLSTTSNSALLCFDARLTNTTSESWNNCKVILSTSQTTFSGLKDAIPTLVPWRVKLAKGRGYDGILNSREEVDQKGGWQAQQNAWVAAKPRNQLFGLGEGSLQAGKRNVAWKNDDAPAAPFSNSIAAPQQQMQQLMRKSSPAPQAAAAYAQVQQSAFGQPGGSLGGGGNVFGSAPHGATLAFGGMHLQNETVQRSEMPRLFSKKAKARGGDDGRAYEGGAGGSESEEEYADTGFGLFDDATINPAAREIEFQESSFEETGLTATYDLPGLKTLIPSSTASKQRVARISFASVAFSHIVVAKYKPVAFLKARLRNASKLTLLKGEAGLTLDGSFMGRSTLPRCSAGDSFTMSLGVDPAIRVAYPKPDVRRAIKGILSKEDSSVYKRFVTIYNTRASAGKPVTLSVLDQVPVSEDEKLRIALLEPRGMVVAGQGVAAGVTAKEDAKDWGKATATLKKAGEIAWEVTLNAGRGVKLALEYEVALPVGEGVIQC